MNLKDEDLVSAVALVVDAGEGDDEALAAPDHDAAPEHDDGGSGAAPDGAGS
jgi:hypothetical protein